MKGVRLMIRVLGFRVRGSSFGLGLGLVLGLGLLGFG